MKLHEQYDQDPTLRDKWVEKGLPHEVIDEIIKSSRAGCESLAQAILKRKTHARKPKNSSLPFPAQPPAPLPPQTEAPKEPRRAEEIPDEKAHYKYVRAQKLLTFYKEICDLNDKVEFRSIVKASRKHEQMLAVATRIQILLSKGIFLSDDDFSREETECTLELERLKVATQAHLASQQRKAAPRPQ